MSNQKQRFNKSVVAAIPCIGGLEIIAQLPNYSLFLYPRLQMDYLWTPWRYAYIAAAGKSDGKTGQCIFCELPKLPDQDAKIVYRGQHCFVILNSFPYASGHVMVVPFAHLDELQKLPAGAAQEMMTLSQKMEGILRQIYSPDGVNLGMNIGRAAGAGVAGHIHMHILPRWVGDTNFMTVTGESRVLPENLDETWRKLRGVLEAKKLVRFGETL